MPKHLTTDDLPMLVSFDTNNFIKNQNDVAQSGKFWVTGDFSRIDGRFGLNAAPYGSGRVGDNEFQLNGSMDLNGSIFWNMPGQQTSWRLYQNSTSDLFMMKNYYSKTVVLDVRGANQNVLTDDGEATLSLVRSDADETNMEFMDLYNNGYNSNGGINHGIRIQKRGNGELRKFKFEYSDGTTVDSYYEIDPVSSSIQFNK